MKKLKNSAMLVVAALCGYLALMTPDWKKDMVAATNPGYLANFVSGTQTNIPAGCTTNCGSTEKSGWLWRGTNSGDEGKLRIWEANWDSQNAAFVPRAVYFPANYTEDYSIQTFGDYDGDGDADIFWRNNVTPNGLWKSHIMEGGLRTGQQDAGLWFDAPHAYVTAGSGDTDADLDDDVIVYNPSTGTVEILVMNNFAATRTVVGTKAGYQVERVGDFDGDGDADLVLREQAGQAEVIWELNGNAFVQEIALPAMATGWASVCAADFDKDGDADIMVTRASDGAHKWYEMENNARVSQKFTGSSLAWTFLACVDVDADGDADTLWTQADGTNRWVTYENFVYESTIRTHFFGGSYNGYEFRGSGN